MKFTEVDRTNMIQEHFFELLKMVKARDERINHLGQLLVAKEAELYTANQKIVALEEPTRTGRVNATTARNALVAASVKARRGRKGTARHA